MRKTVANWSDIHTDLLSQTADRIKCLRDFIIFGAVCRSWRSVASPEKFNKSPKTPWLLLDDQNEEEEHDRRRKFLKLSKDAIYSINIPKPSKRWYLIVGTDVELGLLNPFSLSRIDLPRKNLVQCNIIGFALSSSPSVASDFTIMIVYFSYKIRLTYFSFWKNGYREWTDSEKSALVGISANITYHNSRFYTAYVFSFYGIYVHEIDIQDSESVSIRSKLFNGPSLHNAGPLWTVGSSRGLMIMTWKLKSLDSEIIDNRLMINDDLYSHPHFEFLVQEIEFEKGECRKVTDLGDEALFLGYYSSYLVDVSNESKFKSNHIYFTENSQLTWWCRSGGGVGVYNMIDRSLEPLFNMADSGYGYLTVERSRAGFLKFHPYLEESKNFEALYFTPPNLRIDYKKSCMA
ncbi:putative F-box protein At1g65770 [Mercurialis annua]|uniref:putative F-box protein At1g65770 n=1 Tax=Mercurialis annua TaxID=3986 RepID=UPI0024AF7759|nr:putative F-box protein At1g65770 [Mercurialis annua]